MSEDLVARLRHAWDEWERQLDEDEREAQGLLGATRIVGKIPNFYSAGGPAAESYWGHFTPHRVLAEVERGRRDIAAKRRILDEADAVREEVRNPNSAEHRANARARQFAYEQVVELLAAAEGLT